MYVGGGHARGRLGAISVATVKSSRKGEAAKSKKKTQE